MLSPKIVSIALLSAATLLLETTLTRLLAVTQFYHFAFLVVSLALLGFGASGTLLSIAPGLRAVSQPRFFAHLGLTFAFSIGLAYAVVNFLPFDSYSIAWDRRQIWLFALYYLTLTAPFLISGLGIGVALISSEGGSHRIYAANLVGSGLGALLAPAVLWLSGVPGAVLVSVLFGLAITLISLQNSLQKRGVSVLLIGFLIFFMGLSSLNFQSRAPLGMTISPYKGLAQALRLPDARILFSRWNAIFRLDVLTGAGTHQLPGLSYLYPDLPPPQNGISVDADSLQAVTLVDPTDFSAAGYLPEALAFEIAPPAHVLILNPGGGLGVLQALAGGADQVTAVLDNSLVVRALAQTSPEYNPYAASQVDLVETSSRVYLQRESATFDLVYLPLTDAYRPVASGAYSLAENYSLTVEAFSAMLDRLDPQGVLVFTRWMQVPPSESVRVTATLVEALERRKGLPAAETLVIYRGIQTITVLARPAGWSPEMLATARRFTQDRKFDLVWLPDIQVQETNRFNRLPEPSYYLSIRELLLTDDRSAIYQNNPYQISPPTDDHPFFFHFFKWEQTPQVVASLGHTWQPFGGSGYLVLIAMLALTVFLSAGLIWLPMLWKGDPRPVVPFRRSLVLFYFALIGLAFLFIEIPLIQRWILFLGHPTYAFAVVVAVLLFFSGIGSAFARSAWVPRRAAWIALPVLTLLVPWGLAQISDLILSWPAWARLGVTIFSLAPLGIAMGLPFPLGLALLESRAPGWMPWAWAVNGCASVVASVLAAILSLSAGFSFVILLGAGAYAGAAGLYLWMEKSQ